MKCYNSHSLYCYCETVLKNKKKCPLIEIKKVIDEHKSNSRVYTDEFVKKIIGIFDTLEINTSESRVTHESTKLCM